MINIIIQYNDSGMTAPKSSSKLMFSILTTFPEFFHSPLQVSILKRAQEKKLVNFNFLNLRHFSQDRRRTTDDLPYGGGAGMVMKVEPIARALDVLRGQNPAPHTLLLSARGRRFTQAEARRLVQFPHLALICGHYGDVDQRVADHLVDEELSIGDFILTGGEGAALILIDALTRLIPGVLGNLASLTNESHHEVGLLSPPQYTRPELFRGWPVPPELLSGNPKLIAQWQARQTKQAPGE